MVTKKLGTMTLSLDVELSWGRFDKLPLDELNAESMKERANIKRLLQLLDRYDIPATWAVTGHLMLDGCTRSKNGVSHADLLHRPAFSWFPFDWYCNDPCSAASESPSWYAPDILKWIRGARVRHEIGSHSFGHIYYGDRECTASIAESDLQAALEAAAAKGILIKSFVFPRNQVGYLPLLRKAGLTAYRGPDDPLIRSSNRGFLRIVHFLDQMFALKPRAIKAEQTPSGLWNIPGNHFYMGRNGIRKYIPISRRVLKGKKGIDEAVRTGGLYHLWFHPFNLNEDSDKMLSGLERIFSYACGLKEKGLLDIFTMGEYARRLQNLALSSNSRSLQGCTATR